MPFRHPEDVLKQARDRAEIEQLAPRYLLAATLPSKILFQDGYSDVYASEFNAALMQNFTVIGGSTANASVVNQLRAQGKLFLYSVSYNRGLSVQDLVNSWAAPFNNTLGGALTGGFDGIEIDEFVYGDDGNKVAAALQQLRTQYPNKVIATYTALDAINPSNDASVWNAVNSYADIVLYEAYVRENQAPYYATLSQWAAGINSFSNPLLKKTIFALISAQAADPGDGLTSIGFLGHLDQQMHTIRVNPIAAQMPGVGSYVYSQRDTTDFMGKAMNHYYTQNLLSYYGDGDGDYAQDIVNPSFESSTANWTLTPGTGGSVGRISYSGTGIPQTHDLFGQTDHGDFALRMVRGSTADEASYLLNVDPNWTYTVSAFVAPAPGQNANSAHVKITTTTGTLVAERRVFEQSQLANVDPWRRIYFTFQPPAGQTQVKIVLTDDSVAASTTLYWDFIEAEDNSPVGTPSPGITVIDEDFQDEVGGLYQDNSGNEPVNTNRPGRWFASGHNPNANTTSNHDFDWHPLVQNEIPAGMSTPTSEYMATLNRVGNQTGTLGVFNMDGILKFTLADGTPRPAVTGDKIIGSFDYYQQDGAFGFGFTNSIPSLQAYQAAMPAWTSGVAPLMMPTGYSDMEGATRVGISPNITGEMSMNGGNGNLYAHAVVDVAENSGAGDGFVDMGNSTPKVNPASTANRPLGAGASNPQTIRFQYTVGNSFYDVLQVDQDGPNLPGGFVDIKQSSVAGTTPNPNGPMPVGKVLNSIEGMFITGASKLLTEVWYDNILVKVVSPTNTAWIVNGSGNWSVGSNWSGGTAPNSVDAKGTFGGVISAPRVVAVDTPISVGTITFDSLQSYTVGGANALTLDVTSGSAVINVNNGNHTISAPLTLNDNAAITVTPDTSTLSLTGNLTATGKTLTKAGAGTLQIENARASAMNINAGKVIVRSKPAANSAAGTSLVGGLSIASNSRLDLTNNSMAVDYTGSSPATQIRNWIIQGRNNGAWNGDGIHSSAASGATGTALGYSESSSVYSNFPANFAGVDVDSSAILIAYTYEGDANLDHIVNTLDFTSLATNFGGSARMWHEGDFNYDGRVNALDFNALATHFGTTAASPPPPSETIQLVQSVPIADLFGAVPIGSSQRDIDDVLGTNA